MWSGCLYPGLLFEHSQQIGQGFFQVLAVDHEIYEAAFQQKLGGLEAFGQVAFDGFADHARAGEADEGAGFGEVDIDVPFKVAKQKLVDEFDRRYLQALLEAHDNNISAAARAAGIERMSIYKMIRRLGLDEDSNNEKRREGEEDDSDDE